MSGPDALWDFSSFIGSDGAEVTFFLEQPPDLINALSADPADYVLSATRVGVATGYGVLGTERLEITSLSVRVVPIPEPSAALAFVTGLGVVSLSMRTSRRAAR